MIYGQWRTLISMVIVLGLAVGFLWGAGHVLGNLTGSAAAPALTPTPRPVVEQPTVVTPSTRARHSAAAHRRAITPVHPAVKKTTRHAHPAPAPKGPPKVYMTAAEFDKAPVSAFRRGVDKIWCHVLNSALPTQPVTLIFRWHTDDPSSWLNDFRLPRQTGPATDNWYAYPAGRAGKYGCDVLVNGQPFGTTHFTVKP